MDRSKIAVISPLAVIAAGFACASLLSPLLRGWTFIPLALIYWGGTFAVSRQYLKMPVAGLFATAQNNILWMVLCLIVGLIPLPILLLNLHLLNSPVLIAIWLAFAVINPFFEEIYWRGFLLTALPLPKGAAVAYSTLLFTASHPLMWGVFSVANRSPVMLASLLLMGFVWSMAFLKTGSLRWPVVSHFLVDIFNMAVFVFLNLYVPPAI